MRFVKTLVISFGVLAVVVGLLYVSYAHIIAWWESRQLASQIQSLVRLAKDPLLSHKKACEPLQPPIVQDEEETSPFRDVLGYQLRFVNEQEYVIEAVCKSLSKKTIEIDGGRLGRIVKVAGSGVLVPVSLYSQPVTRDEVRDPLNGTVFVEYKHVVREIGFVDGVLINTVSTGEQTDVETVDQAVAACQGFGYSCCDAGVEAGEGALMSSAIDCPKSCYPVCVKKPSVLFFNTDPIVDAQNRRLEIRANQAVVTFGYEIVPGDNPVVVRTLDYGDGSKQGLATLSEAVSHRYNCPTDYCEFAAQLIAQDTAGYTLSPSRFNTITVVLSTK